MTDTKNINYILIFLITIVVTIYLGKLLYGNMIKIKLYKNELYNYKTTYFDEKKKKKKKKKKRKKDISELIEPIPNKIFIGPINKKADLSRTKI
jgi:hypothetical protein